MFQGVQPLQIFIPIKLSGQGYIYWLFLKGTITQGNLLMLSVDSQSI